MITSTVAVTGGILPRLPVIGSGEVPKAKLAECLAKIYRTKAAAPVMYGEVIISNICGTGVDIIASRPIAAGGRT
jgi:CxxC motif-containing protein